MLCTSLDTFRSFRKANNRLIVLSNLQNKIFLMNINTFLFYRRIHITEETKECLNGEYELEDGNGASRNQYLNDKNYKTYLIVQTPRNTKVKVVIENNVCDRRY